MIEELFSKFTVDIFFLWYIAIKVVNNSTQIQGIIIPIIAPVLRWDDFLFINIWFEFVKFLLSSLFGQIALLLSLSVNIFLSGNIVFALKKLFASKS